MTSYSRPRNSAKSVNTELSSAEMGAAMRKSSDGSGAKLGAADPLKSARRVPEASERRPLKRRGSRHGGCPPPRSRSARLARLLRWFLCAFWWGGGLAPAPHTNRSHSPLSCLVPLFVLLVMTDFRRLRCQTMRRCQPPLRRQRRVHLLRRRCLAHQCRARFRHARARQAC